MRQIPWPLKEYIDAKILLPNSEIDATEVMLAAATALIGTTEDVDPEIVDSIRRTISRPWGEPWCVDFVQTCIAYAEVITGIKSPLAATEGVLDLWSKSKFYEAIAPARRGDIILWRMGDTSEGHCGLITGMDSLRYYTIEGNTSGLDEIDRMGRGVFAKSRAKGGSKTFKELGFLRCFP